MFIETLESSQNILFLQEKKKIAFQSQPAPN